MNSFRPHNSSTVFIWIALLSVALLVTQNLKFHVHTMDHDPVQSDHHASTIATPAEHEHTDLMHLSIDASHADHHDSVIVETDANLDRIFQQLTSKASPIDLLALCLVLFILFRQIFQRSTIRHACSVLPRQRFHLIPPLRAPPR